MLRNQIQQLTSEQRVRLAALLAERNVLSPESSTELVAWIQTTEDAPEDAQIRQQLSKRLPPAMVPQRLVRVASMPRTSTGKVDRRQLKEMTTTPSTPTAAPKNTAVPEHQAILLQICQDLLGATDVSGEDNFFNVGGDSLMSIKLVAMARDRGLQLEPEDLYEATTLTELANRAAKRMDAPQQPTRRDTESFRPYQITEVRAGSSQRSILFLNSLGGAYHHEHSLTSLLSQPWSILASRQTTPLDQTSPVDTIEQIARQYITEWKRLAPNGPRVVVGFCWAAILAYEVAQQMRRSGEPVKLIIIEGGFEQTFRLASAPRRFVDYVRGQAFRVVRKIRWIAYDRRRILGKPTANGEPAIEQKVHIEGYDLDADIGDPELIRRNIVAMQAYKFQPLQGELDFFVASDSYSLVGDKFSNPHRGWGYVCPTGLTCHHIPGDHASCMRPPHAESLASAMNAVIDG